MKTILVIEDNQQLLENTAELLSLSEYKVFTATNGMEGLKKAVEVQPDLILCDIMMPEVDGYGVLHVLQTNSNLQNVPFIFMTAKTEINDMRKGMSLGADDYIIKPFAASDLLTSVEGRLRKAELCKKKNGRNVLPVDNCPEPFSGEKALQQFVSGRDADVYKKKQRIYTEGNHAIRLYYVQKGRIKVFKINELGKEFIFQIADEGEFFGYTPLIEHSVYHESAEALEDSKLIGIPGSEFEELIRDNPLVLRKFMNLLADDLAEKEEQLLQVAYNSLRKKVANALLVVHQKYKSESLNGGINFSRENMAAIAGAATESVIRTLAEFKVEKLIDIHEGKIRILDLQKLKLMMN